jgi:hypothetical protein
MSSNTIMRVHNVDTDKFDVPQMSNDGLKMVNSVLDSFTVTSGKLEVDAGTIDVSLDSATDSVTVVNTNLDALTVTAGKLEVAQNALDSTTDSVSAVQSGSWSVSSTKVVTESGSKGNLSSAQAVVASDYSTNSVSTVGKAKAKLIVESSTASNTADVLVEISDGTNWMFYTSLVLQDGGTGRVGSLDIDVSCVSAVRLQYQEADTMTSTLLMA